MMRTLVLAGLAVWTLAWTAPALRARADAQSKPDSYEAGRIFRADGTKIIVSSFVLEAGRVAYRLKKDAEPSSLDLSRVKSLQVRLRPTFAGTSQAILLGAFAGGVVCLMVADAWGGPWKDTWPAIGAGTAAFAAAGAVIELTVKRYRTVYTNPDLAPKPIIKLEMGPVAPRTPGISLSISY